MDRRSLAQGGVLALGIGHYTGFSGAEGLQEGAIHFASEHTSVDFQGYIEGAARSGERVAQEIAQQT